VRAANELAIGAIAAATLPLLAGLAAAVGAYATGLSRGGAWPHFLALLLGWLVGAMLLVCLRRGHAHRARPSSAQLVLASAASFGSFLGLAFLLDPWQELMSVPGATPMMVIKDLTATFAPFLAAFVMSWLVLRLARAHYTPTAGGGLDSRPHNNEMQQTSHG